ncbi:CBS domain-containing protein [Solimonas terrae]|uniref:CBS domain-containing protein n=1 Tax=Solimonas terrae TaxID=1396819 RepID=A0A6M2BRB5_9GAMM|nr:CBS domain-containing protein [Solimonas terrae]NGY05028.1 CBS domain-containing protein [Solimonas terrae]
MATLEKVCVRDYMSSRLMTFTPEMEVMNAVHQLVKSGHSGAPVVDASGKLVGMLSERDCLQIAMVAAQDTCVAGPISQYMSTTVETVSSDTSLTHLAGLFINNSHFRRYPVVDDGKLVGQISRSDVLRAISHCC